MKIVVLGGGMSSEREVSLSTSVSVCTALRSLGHQAIFVDMFFGLEHYEGALEDVFDVSDGFCQSVSISRAAPNIQNVVHSRREQTHSKLGNRVLEVCQMADCVFLGLHGVDGEDGRIQGTFDLLGIPYTGSGHMGSALGMNKIFTKMVMTANGIPTSPYTRSTPCVIKLVNGGSSIGTWICHTDLEMQTVLQSIQTEDGTYFIEKFISGREFTVPVLDEKALDVIEIVAPNGKFDYISKYQSGSDGAKELCPAPITAEQKEQMQSLAVKIHKALGLKVYSRSDFILDKDGVAWCLEVNTLPGMTPNSLLPKAAKLSGLDYPHLCEKIVQLSLKRD